MYSVLVIILFAALSGCINVTTKTVPDRLEVAEVREASDCVPNLLGISFGTASYDQALKNQTAIIAGDNKQRNQPPLTKVRSVGVTDYMFFAFGARCVELTGE